MNRSQSTDRRRIWSDPHFYAVLSVIGGTYVLLIFAMLVADAMYMFTSEMGKPVRIDFSTSGQGSPLETGDVVADQFRRYGLSISTGDARHPAVILDSGRPSAANSDLGTPHVDFGGPGIGRGGRDDRTGPSNPGKNNMPLGNLLVVASKAPPFASSNEGEVVVDWAQPVAVDAVWITGPCGPGGTIRSLDADGRLLARQTVNAAPGGGRRRVEIGLANVSHMVLAMPAGVRDVEVAFTARASAPAKLSVAQTKTLQHGHVHVVPKGIKRVEPKPDGGRLMLAWADPIRLDKLQLLDIDRPGGKLTTYDVDGNVLSVRKLRDLGPNSVQTVEYTTENRRTGQREAGEPGVARLEVDLPCGGAVSEIDFSWSGRVRAAWERHHPVLARWLYNPITAALGKPEIQYSIKLSLIACTITAILSLWIAIPVGYLLSRHRFFGRDFLDAVLDIPIVLPPLVVGLSLLILFQFAPRAVREAVVYQIPAVILAQFAVACAFAVRIMRATFDQIDARREQVALTLGCSRVQAFGMVVLPEASRGILTAGTLAWARALGEFGPLLIFAGATRNKTEVLSTTVFLELSIGDLGAAVAVSLIMVLAAVIVLVVARLWGTRTMTI